MLKILCFIFFTDRTSINGVTIFQTMESSAREFLGKGNSATLVASVVCLHFLKFPYCSGHEMFIKDFIII